MKIGSQELGAYPLWVGFWLAAIIILILFGQT